VTLRRLNASVLSPLLLFPLVWVAVALLAQIHILHIQGAWSTVMIAVVAAVPIAFVSGGLIGEGIAVMSTAVSGARGETQISDRSFRRVLLVLLGIGLLAVAYQFAKAGRPPLLSGSIDETRFSEGGPSILLTDLLTIVVIVAMTRARNPFGRESRFELAVSVVALGAFALQAGRGNVVLPIIVVIIARWLYWGRPSTYLITGGALFAFVAICAGFYLRTYQHPTTPFEAELFGEVLPPLPFFIKPLIPLYLALTTNFVALEGIVNHIPTAAPFGHGIYDAVAFDRVFSGARHIGDLSGELTPPWVTSTVAGSFWADDGFPLLVPGIATTGALAAGAYAAAARTSSFRWCLVSGYLTYVALFGLYTNFWTQQIDWLIVAPLLLVFGAFAEDPAAPPGVVGTAWGKIRQMRAGGAGGPLTEKQSSDGSATPARPPGRRLGGGPPAAIISGILAVAVLLIAGVIIQRTLPEPFQLSRTMSLPSSLTRAAAIFTDSQRVSDNTPVWWISRARGTRVLSSFDPATQKAQVDARFHAIRRPGATYYDIGYWNPLRVPALFEVQQAPKRLYVTVRRSDTGAAIAHYSTPIAAPPPGVYRSFEIGSLNAPRSDLYIVDRGPTTSRVRLSILSGESGFSRQAFATFLPFRGLGPRRWSIGLGELAGKTLASGKQATPRPDLFLLERDPGRAHTNLKVLPGEESFAGFAYQRDIDEPGDLPASRLFLQGAWQGAPALFEVIKHTPSGPELKIFDIQAPAGLL
jgi:hypothetical protein